MNNLVKPLAINYLEIAETAEIGSIIEMKFSRLRQVCNYIQTCQIKLANVAYNSTQSVGHSYSLGISLHLSQGVELYSLRLPSGSQD